MLLGLRSLCFPTSYRVALRAIRAELPAMNIRVAIGALSTDIFEFQAGVAERARHFFVHAKQRVPSCVVVEFRNAADGFPARVRMAIFAGDGNETMGISRRALRARLCAGDRSAEHHEQ